MKRMILGGIFFAAISCAGSGTETDNPATLTGFTSSACKTETTDPGRQALVLESDAEGLQCVEWSPGAAGALELRLLNFPEACGNDYEGTAATAADGTLELAVHKTTCDVLRCGWCVFDFGYTLTGIDATRPLAVHLGSAICATEPTTFADEVTLPLDQQASGVVCRYLEHNATEQYGRARSSCGERNMPCGACNGTDSSSCADGLTCTEVASSDSRCLASCTTDADCTAGLTTCQDGLCRASQSW